MAQPPFLVDQIQIEPGSSGTRLISRDSSGELKFQDPVTTLLLSQMAGSRNITGVFVVGRGGSGAAYTSIQDALDDIPSTSSSSSPSVVVVYPGVYQENLRIKRDGVTIIALGEVWIQNDGVSPTIKIYAVVESTPKAVTLRNLTISNDSAGQSCVQVIGADAFASGNFVVNAAPLVAGDTLTIGGVTLTGSTCRTSGSNNFDALLGTPTAIAADIAAAINDPANLFSSLVTATPVGATVQLTAVVAGTAGNAITLAAVTTPAGRITPSGATLSGGSAAGSDVLLSGLFLENCTLNATGLSSYQILANTCNNIFVDGGSFLGSSAGTSVSITNCAKFIATNLKGAYDFGFSYDVGDPQPSILTCEYVLDQISSVGEISADLVGEGSLRILSCPSCGDVGFSGDQALLVKSSSLGDLTLSDTATGTLVLSTRGNAITGGGTPTLQESSFTETIGFVASSLEVVTFSVPQPDANYRIFLDVPSVAIWAGVTSRTTSDFTIETSGALTGVVGYTVVRQLS